MTSLLLRKRNDIFLINIITGDKKWAFYDNVQCKRQWIDLDESLQPTRKVLLHGRKIILCLWWDHHSIIHFEFLNHNKTLNADLYSYQLQCNKCSVGGNSRICHLHFCKGVSGHMTPLRLLLG